MVIRCWVCREQISTSLPNSTVFRGISYCPECVLNGADEKAISEARAQQSKKLKLQGTPTKKIPPCKGCNRPWADCICVRRVS
jgi:hypothetical protein